MGHRREAGHGLAVRVRFHPLGAAGALMTAQTRLPFELDQRAERGLVTAHGGVPLLIEAFRTSGAAAVLDASVVVKRRKRGLLPSQLVEGLFSLWAAGGERCEDWRNCERTPRWRCCSGTACGAADGAGLPGGVRRGGAAALAGCDLPRPRRRRAAPGLGESHSPADRLCPGAGAAGGGDDRRRRDHPGEPEAERPCDYDGRTGYQPVIALWAEQDVVVADEFRDGNVPAGSGNRRLVERAVAARREASTRF